MAKSKLNSFIKRLITSLVLIPIVIGCVVWNQASISLLALTGAALISWEWANMVPNKRQSFYAVTYLAIAAVALLFHPFWGCLATMFGLILTFVKTKGEEHRRLLVLGVPYIAIGLGSIMALYDSYGFEMVLWFMFLVWGVDIGGYLFGTTLKGPKLAPKISPNKTWSGLIGGVILAAAVSCGVCAFFDASPLITGYAVIAAILAVIAQIGDLIESAIKRHLGIKDSSDLIPGHGGIFDRIDGLIFAAPFAYIILTVWSLL